MFNDDILYVPETGGAILFNLNGDVVYLYHWSM